MERSSNNENGHRTARALSDSWEAWDAVPRDGPAVFLVDAEAFDHGVVRGRWLDVTADVAVLQGELTELLGQKPDAGTWAIVDQVGLGGLMAPETLTVTSLTTLAEDMAAETGG